MPISTSDPRYVAEVIPGSIAAMATPLCAHYGVGRDAFGSKGNEFHDYGFHRSENWINLSPDSRYGTSDYSVQGGVNHAPDKNWISAFDFTPGEWGTGLNRQRMREITSRVLAACKAHDPRVGDLYEFAGTLDGSHVVTFDGAGNPRSPFDRTHLDHAHGSLKRSRAGNDHTGIVDVMLGVARREEDDMPYANIVIPGRGEVASVSVPGGNANRAQLYVCATNDTGALDGVAHDYGLRIYISDGVRGWAAATPGGGLVKGHNGLTISVALPGLDKAPDGVRGISVMRAPIDAVSGLVMDPKAALAAHPAGAPAPVQPTWYDGPLTFCIETVYP